MQQPPLCGVLLCAHGEARGAVIPLSGSGSDPGSTHYLTSPSLSFLPWDIGRMLTIVLLLPLL